MEIEMNAKNVTVTRSGRGSWCVSYTSVPGMPFGTVVLGVYRFPMGVREPGPIAYASLNGRVFSSDDEAKAAALEAGFLVRYGRNTCRFVMSRAARKRGIKTTDWMYLQRAEEATAKC